jgi:hypothetical protein
VDASTSLIDVTAGVVSSIRLSSGSVGTMLRDDRRRLRRSSRSAERRPFQRFCSLQTI